MFIHYKPTGKNRWDVRVDKGKKGHIRKERGRFVATLTRHVSFEGLEGICAFVAQLNG